MNATSSATRATANLGMLVSSGIEWRPVNQRVNASSSAIRGTVNSGTLAGSITARQRGGTLSAPQPLWMCAFSFATRVPVRSATAADSTTPPNSRGVAGGRVGLVVATKLLTPRVAAGGCAGLAADARLCNPRAANAAWGPTPWGRHLTRRR